MRKEEEGNREEPSRTAPFILFHDSLDRREAGITSSRRIRHVHSIRRSISTTPLKRRKGIG
jgi:hypothetical protein